MVFSSTVFIFAYLPIILLGYFLIDKKIKNYYLLFVSLIFFGWAQPNYLWIIVLNIIINYTSAVLIENFTAIKKPVMLLSIIANLGILFYFKYFEFAVNSINKICGCNFTISEIVLPIGISFFTFQGVSYVVDVYRKDVPVQKNIFKLGLYIVLFPQLIAGPIVRCQTAHCGRCQPHFDFGVIASPIVPYRNLPQTLDGMTSDCRSFV